MLRLNRAQVVVWIAAVTNTLTGVCGLITIYLDVRYRCLAMLMNRRKNLSLLTLIIWRFIKLLQCKYESNVSNPASLLHLPFMSKLPALVKLVWTAVSEIEIAIPMQTRTATKMVPLERDRTVWFMDRLPLCQDATGPMSQRPPFLEAPLARYP